MSSTIHILQLEESRSKGKTFQKRPFISTPQTKTFRNWCLQVSGTSNSNDKSEYSKQEPPQSTSAACLKAFPSPDSCCSQSPAGFSGNLRLGYMDEAFGFPVTWRCWKQNFCRVQKNDPKQKCHKLCRMLASLIKGFT